MARKPTQTPRRLEALRARFEKWRETREPGSRIPEALWRPAVKLAGKFSVYKIARTLQLDYGTLRKRVQQRAPAQKRSVDFVEIAPSGPLGLTECVVEFENARGSKMRIQLRGADAATLSTLAQSFLREEA